MPITLVIFGASGDLTRRKLMPALFQLYRKNRLPQGTCIVGIARTEFTDDQWRSALAESTRKYGSAFDQATWDKFAAMLHYQVGDIGDPRAFEALAQRLKELEGGQKTTRV